MNVRVIPCGDAALTVAFEGEPGRALTKRIAALAQAFTASQPSGFLESIPGLTTLTVLFDPGATQFDTLRATVDAIASSAATNAHRSRLWRIPVCYDAALAPDLEETAAVLKLSTEALIHTHCTRESTVYLLGFSPGFPYMGDVDPTLQRPRRAEPRARIPPGSVAIATRFTAIYPHETAGGWHLIGSTPAGLFDIERCPPALLAAGDRVRYEPIARDEYDRLSAEYANGRTLEPQ